MPDPGGRYDDMGAYGLLSALPSRACRALRRRPPTIVRSPAALCITISTLPSARLLIMLPVNCDPECVNKASHYFFSVHGCTDLQSRGMNAFDLRWDGVADARHGSFRRQSVWKASGINAEAPFIRPSPPSISPCQITTSATSTRRHRRRSVHIPQKQVSERTIACRAVGRDSDPIRLPVVTCRERGGIDRRPIPFYTSVSTTSPKRPIQAYD